VDDVRHGRRGKDRVDGEAVATRSLTALY
jgi:hypothetical protein